MKWIDAHIHIDQYNKNQQNQILNEMKQLGISALVAVSTDLESCKNTFELSKKDGRILPAFGFHPEQKLPDKIEIVELLTWIRQHAEEAIAIGEVGLPYYLRQEETFLDETISAYVELLEVFVQLAAELRKPIVLHAVYEDADVVIGLLEKYRVKSAHFHWFKGSPETVQKMINNGYFISVTPDVTYEAEIQDLVKQYPLELMMVESDGPWPFEGAFSGEWTNPVMIKESIRKIASIKKCTVEETAAALYHNTKAFYRL